jgi:ribosomal protein S18 acetylase RimI-like enzyme
MPDSISIRAAEDKDFPSVISVVNAAFAIESFLSGTRTDETRMATLRQQGEFLVAEDAGGAIVASVYTEIRGDHGYFGMLAVSPAHQGTGLGRLMIESAEQHCRKRGCHAMDITVLSLRPELPAFYHRLGYVETGTEEFRPSRPLQPGIECHCIWMYTPL